MFSKLFNITDGTQSQEAKDSVCEFKLKQENDALKKDIQELLDQVKELERRIDKMLEQEKDDLDCFAINWTTMRAFSVERIQLDNSMPVHTAIGYFDTEGKVREWYLYCSLKTHKMLVKQFKEFNKLSNA